METYKCDKCGRAVNASCAKCDEPLVNGNITVEDGSNVQVSKCLVMIRRMQILCTAVFPNSKFQKKRKNQS